MNSEKNKFIKRVSMFFILLFLCLFLINFIYIKKIYDKKLFSRKRMDFENYINELDEKKINYLFLGDSHAMKGVNPEYIEGAYNLGYDGENYMETYFKLRRIIEEDVVEIENIVLEIDLHSFYRSTKIKEIEYCSDIALIREMSIANNQTFIETWLDSCIKIIGNGYDLFYLYKNRDKVDICQGYIPKYENFTNKNKELIAKKRCNNQFGRKSIEEDEMFFLLKSMQLAIENDMDIVLIEYPVTREYNFELKNLEINRNEQYSIIFNRISKLFPNLEYKHFDYHNIFFDKNKYFSDSDHLNFTGAKLLSKRINLDFE